MKLWLTIIGMGIITYVIRLSLIVLSERVEITPRVRQALRFVPSAVLSAIVLPELLRPNGVLDLSLANSRLLAGLLAIVVAWRTKNVLLTIAAGMIALWILQAIP